MADSLASLSNRAVPGVSTLVREVSEWLAGRFAVCAVQGEVSGFSRASSGHCYFNLKDADGGSALLRCAMFRRAASLMDFVPREGQLVEIRGRVGVYEPRGELQLVVEAMRGVGAGALYERFIRLRERLGAEGLFDATRKRAIPLYPRRVGIVTSVGAAAMHDVLTALARRAPHVGVIVYPSLVQGAEAPAALVTAIGQVSQRSEVDALIVCRGGGSLEDLWAFNDEAVVRAVAACAVPVICGVGHETDVTLCDLAADLRAPTPTAAAELAAPARAACLVALDEITSTLRRRAGDILDTQGQRLDRAAMRLARPGRSVTLQRERVATLRHRLADVVPRDVSAQRQCLGRATIELERALRLRLRGQAQVLHALSDRLRALDPQQVLSRGYAWIADPAGKPLTSSRQLEVGTTLEAVLHDGVADVEVKGVRGRSIG